MQKADIHMLERVQIKNWCHLKSYLETVKSLVLPMPKKKKKRKSVPSLKHKGLLKKVSRSNIQPEKMKKKNEK